MSHVRTLCRVGNPIGEIIAVTLLEMEVDWMLAERFFLVHEDPIGYSIMIAARDKHEVGIHPMTVPSNEQRAAVVAKHNEREVLITVLDDKAHARVTFDAPNYRLSLDITIMQSFLIANAILGFLKDGTRPTPSILMC